MGEERILFLTNTNVFTIKEKYRFLKKKFFAKYFNYSDYFQSNGFDKLYSQILSIIDKDNINITIIHGYYNSFELDINFIKKLNEKTFTVYWGYDDWTNYDYHSNITSFFTDLHITLSIESFYSKKKIRQDSLYLPDFFDHTKFETSKKQYLYDVCFVGRLNEKSNRKKYLEFLKKKNINLYIHDPHKNGFLSEKEIHKLYSQSKININFTGCTTNLNFGSVTKINPLSEIYYGFKGRAVEIALTKSFVISEPFPEYEILYKNRELPIFYSPDDLYQKIKIYLEKENERLDIVNKLYQHSLENFTEKNNIDKIVKKLNKARNLKREKHFNYRYENIKNIKSFYFKICEIMWILIYLSKFISKGKIILFFLNFKYIFKNGILYLILGIWFYLRYFIFNLIKKFFKINS